MTKQRKIVYFSIFGLVGPILGWVSAYIETEAINFIVVTLWPTWVFGWYVMGVESETIQIAIFIFAAILNVICWLVFGLICSNFQFKNLAVSILAAIPVYGGIYAIAWFSLLFFERLQ